MVTAATPPTLLRSACQKSCDLSHNSAHKHVSALVMQALANDMPALAPSSECAIARGMGGASPQAPGVYRGLLLETKKMSQGGLVEDQERPRRSPAKAKGGLWAHSAISRSQSVKPQKSKSAKPAARPPPHPSECFPTPFCPIWPMAISAQLAMSRMHNELVGLLRHTLSA